MSIIQSFPRVLRALAFAGVFAAAPAFAQSSETPAPASPPSATETTPDDPPASADVEPARALGKALLPRKKRHLYESVAKAQAAKRARGQTLAQRRDALKQGGKAV